MGTRRQSGMELNPISWPEMESWARLSYVTLLPWEVDVLNALEAQYISMRRNKESS